MENVMAMDNIFLIMENMKGNLKMVQGMVKEFFLLKMEIFIKANF
jgi:hypothetical protein